MRGVKGNEGANEPNVVDKVVHNEDNRDSSESSDEEEDDVVDNEGDLDEAKDSDNGEGMVLVILLWDYADEIRKTTPSSTVIVGTEQTDGDESETRSIHLYVRQTERLMQAFDEVFPGAEHRYCVRHLHNNFKQAGFRGLAFKNALWKAAKACTVGEWKLKMQEMKSLSQSAHDWFNDKPTTQWSKSHFSEVVVCDMAVYAPAIKPMSHEGMWFESCIIPPLPPNFGRRAGRPTKARRRELDEPTMKHKKKGKRSEGGKLRRHQKTVSCRTCGEPGHNTAEYPERVPLQNDKVKCWMTMCKHSQLSMNQMKEGKMAHPTALRRSNRLQSGIEPQHPNILPPAQVNNEEDATPEGGITQEEIPPPVVAPQRYKTGPSMFQQLAMSNAHLHQ
ncbi:UNVERIFIED_CONTAM: hypothetical protein Scaly_0586200 [Sesamum calycinum]|uniref:CCHC-type domain-containing protein n=1 Tax=Sesamum calycinum TaxID=2727403 RepID=A0AAW2RSD8_9LAMI